MCAQGRRATRVPENLSPPTFLILSSSCRLSAQQHRAARQRRVWLDHLRVVYLKDPRLFVVSKVQKSTMVGGAGRGGCAGKRAKTRRDDRQKTRRKRNQKYTGQAWKRLKTAGACRVGEARQRRGIIPPTAQGSFRSTVCLLLHTCSFSVKHFRINQRLSSHRPPWISAPLHSPLWITDTTFALVCVALHGIHAWKVCVHKWRQIQEKNKQESGICMDGGLDYYGRKRFTLCGGLVYYCCSLCIRQGGGREGRAARAARFGRKPKLWQAWRTGHVVGGKKVVCCVNGVILFPQGRAKSSRFLSMPTLSRLFCTGIGHSYLIRNPDRLVRGLADFSGHS